MTTPPEISVIIPVYNDPAGVSDTLETVLSQTYSREYEVLVVDNNSTDSTADVIRSFADRDNRVQYLAENDVQSSYAARNTGIEHASGSIFAFVDADMSVCPEWLEEISRAFDESDSEYLGWGVEVYVPEGEGTFWAQYDAALGLPTEHYFETKRFVPTCALAVRSGVFEQVGTFDESLVSGGDKEFGQRVHDAGLSTSFLESLTVRHPARTTFREHMKKALRIGRGFAERWGKRDRGGAETVKMAVMRLLPPSPNRIRNRSLGFHWSKFPQIYLAEYVLKLVQTAGAGVELIGEKEERQDTACHSET